MSINVLLVDDDPTTRKLLSYFIEGTPDLRIIGQAVNGREAVQKVEELSPDVVLMDVNMPEMNGLEATREIMDRFPTPIVVFSASSRDANIAFQAVDAGAVSILKKPGMTQSLSYQDSVKEFLNTLRAMARVRVIRHAKAGRTPIREKTEFIESTAGDARLRPEIISIVASTGGPQTLGGIIKNLPSTFKLPVVIVQHITPEFVTPLVNWLNAISQLPIRIAQSSEPMLPGTIYLAPGNRHLQLTHDGSFELSNTPANVPHIPSGDVLLTSVAQHYGARAVGIVMTGMGKDGAAGLRAMYEAGAMTIAQDEASCVVFGMPQEAIALGAVRRTLSASDILKLLLQYVDDGV